MSSQTEIPKLVAEKRERLGSTAVRELRGMGMVPGQLYGRGEPNTTIKLVEADLEKALKGIPAIIEISLDGQSEFGLIKEVQYDTFGQHVINIDMQRVKLDDQVDVTVPIEYFGTPKGTELGARLEVMWNEVRMRVRADSIPNQIVVDVSTLGVDESKTFADLEVPANSSILNSLHSLICRCAIPRRVAALRKKAEGEAAAGKPGKK